MTRKQLADFIRRRNTSEFQTNLQFGIDMNAAGILTSDLGKVTKEEWGWAWQTRYGRLEERHGKLSLISPVKAAL